MRKYRAQIRATLEGRVLETIYADYEKETMTMAERSAERLMLSQDITEGAFISIWREFDKMELPGYYWPQLEGNTP